MLDTSWHQDARKRTRTLQLVIVAAVAVSALFLSIVLITGPAHRGPIAHFSIPLTWIAILVACLRLLAAPVVQAFNLSRARRQILRGTYRPAARAERGEGSSFSGGEAEQTPEDAESLLAAFHGRTVTGAAMLEGCAFLATQAYLLEGDPVTVILAALLTLGVAAHFPTQSRVVRWVEEQLDLLKHDRQLSMIDTHVVGYSAKANERQCAGGSPSPCYREPTAESMLNYIDFAFRYGTAIVGAVLVFTGTAALVGGAVFVWMFLAAPQRFPVLCKTPTVLALTCMIALSIAIPAARQSFRASVKAYRAGKIAATGEMQPPQGKDQEANL